jgi:hypothetical protein
MQQNLNPKVVSADNTNDILTKIGELKDLVDNITVEIPAEQAAELIRLGDARQMYDQKCDEYMHQQPATRPQEIDLTAYDNDGASKERLANIRAALLPILARIEGSAALHGSDRMSGNLLYTGYLKFGKRFGVPNAQTIYQDIMQHYPGGRPAGSGGTPTPPPAP